MRERNEDLDVARERRRWHAWQKAGPVARGPRGPPQRGKRRTPATPETRGCASAEKTPSSRSLTLVRIVQVHAADEIDQVVRATPPVVEWTVTVK